MNDKNKWIVGGTIVLLLLVYLWQKGYKRGNNQQEKTDTINEQLSEKQNMSNSPKQYDSPPEMQIDTGKKYTAVMETSKGTMTFDLFAEETPIAVNNFVFLARDGFYDNTIFHRIIKGFMIQGGDPLGNGTGNPGYKFADEPIIRDYERGILAMANSGPDTNGSQFFIVHEDTQLPKNYVIFGKLTDGFDTLDDIASTPVTTNAMGEKSSPTEEVKILDIKITED